MSAVQPSRPFKLVSSFLLFGALHRAKELQARASEEVTEIQEEILERHRKIVADHIFNNPRGNEQADEIMLPWDIMRRQEEAKFLHRSALIRTERARCA